MSLGIFIEGGFTQQCKAGCGPSFPGSLSHLDPVLPGQLRSASRLCFPMKKAVPFSLVAHRSKRLRASCLPDPSVF